jgi:hypothetical protein
MYVYIIYIYISLSLYIPILALEVLFFQNQFLEPIPS